MLQKGVQKLSGERGAINRLVALLLVLVIALAAVAIQPSLRWFHDQSERHACEAGMDTAWRKMAEDYIINGSTKTGEVKAAVGHAMSGWDDICPGGGKVYLVVTRKNRDKSSDKAAGRLPYELVCGKHDKDDKLRTRLNADDILKQIQNYLFEQHRRGNHEIPKTITVTYNSKPLVAELVDKKTGLKRGTGTTSGLEKKEAVCYYSIVGHSDFGADSGEKEGNVWYLSFADKWHCANWSSSDGWTGDSFEGLSE